MEFEIYHFSNAYLKSIQHGIQAAHAQTAMALKYCSADGGLTDEYLMWLEWATKHKTMQCMNGGDNESMLGLLEFAKRDDCKLPWSYFYESPGALNGTLTNVAFVVPDRLYKKGIEVINSKHSKLDIDGDIYTYVQVAVGDSDVYEFTSFEHALMSLIRRSRYAT